MDSSFFLSPSLGLFYQDENFAENHDGQMFAQSPVRFSRKGEWSSQLPWRRRALMKGFSAADESRTLRSDLRLTIVSNRSGTQLLESSTSSVSFNVVIELA